MNLRSIMTTIPLVRRAWRVIPGPWRLPLLLVGGGWWLYQRFSSDPSTDSAS